MPGLLPFRGPQLVEAATDPAWLAVHGWGNMDADHLAWEYFPGAELADLCEYGTAGVRSSELGYVVARVWSNAASRAYVDPCIPALSDYLNSAALFTQSLPYQETSTETEMTKGIQVPMGQTKTVDLLLFGASAGTWDLSAIDSYTYLGLSPVLRLSLSASKGKVGDRVQLTIKRVGPTQPNLINEVVIQASTSQAEADASAGGDAASNGTVYTVDFGYVTE